MTPVPPRPPDEPPPFLGRWNRLYAIVAGLLVAQIVIFWLLGRWAT